jgi:phosphatidylinositol phospholipase C, beta
LKRKILIKNKRLKPEDEKRELELFWRGEFVIEDEVKEDASAVKQMLVIKTKET